MGLLSTIQSKAKNIYRDLLGYPRTDISNVETPDNSHDILDSSQVHENPPTYHPSQLEMQDDEGQLAVDVYHTADDVVVKAPVAGVSLDDIDITVADGILTIRGYRKKENEIAKEDFYLEECYWGHFSRSIVLPDNLQTEKIKAYFKNGILKITIPKEERIKIKTIPINKTMVNS